MNFKLIESDDLIVMIIRNNQRYVPSKVKLEFTISGLLTKKGKKKVLEVLNSYGIRWYTDMHGHDKLSIPQNRKKNGRVTNKVMTYKSQFEVYQYAIDEKLKEKAPSD